MAVSRDYRDNRRQRNLHARPDFVIKLRHKVRSS